MASNLELLGLNLRDIWAERFINSYRKGHEHDIMLTLKLKPFTENSLLHSSYIGYNTYLPIKNMKYQFSLIAHDDSLILWLIYLQDMSSDELYETRVHTSQRCDREFPIKRGVGYLALLTK